MKRLTMDKPFDFLEAICNMVYPVDGWAHIRTNMDERMPITDFCLKLCDLNGCDMQHLEGEEAKDEVLCGCAIDGCPISTVYATLCGYSHLRSRLKMYEDAGMKPPKED